METVSPAMLKTLSDATLVAGIQRYFFARDDISDRSACAVVWISMSRVSLRWICLHWIYLHWMSLTVCIPCFLVIM